MASFRYWHEEVYRHEIADQSPLHVPAPELPSRPASELVTPDLYCQAYEDCHRDVCFRGMHTEFDGLYRAGSVERDVRDRWWHVATKRHRRHLIQVGLPLED